MSTMKIEPHGDVLVVTASQNLREFDSRFIDEEGTSLLGMLDDPRYRHVVMDLSGTDYYGSSALNLFLKIDRKVHQKEGQMILVGLSPHEFEVLNVTGLGRRWTHCKTRDEAFSRLGKATASC